MLSAFAFAPSVFAQDIPLITLSVENIQVRAEWKVVGEDADHFSVKGGILKLRPNVSGAGHPDGNTITAIVEVRDKFSTLNPSYEDLTVSVTITAVIMGCREPSRRYFAKAYGRPSGQIVVGNVAASGTATTVEGEVIQKGNSLYEVSDVIDVDVASRTYITTNPTSLYDELKWDTHPDTTLNGYTSLVVNESADCFGK